MIALISIIILIQKDGPSFIWSEINNLRKWTITCQKNGLFRFYNDLILNLIFQPKISPRSVFSKISLVRGSLAWSFMLLFKKYLELPDYLKTQKCIQKEAKSEILNVNMVKLTAIYTGSRNSDRILILDFITISNRNFWSRGITWLVTWSKRPNNITLNMVIFGLNWLKMDILDVPSKNFDRILTLDFYNFDYEESRDWSRDQFVGSFVFWQLKHV